MRLSDLRPASEVHADLDWSMYNGVVLDICCSAGGASRGYKDATKRPVYGIDIVPQKNYPYPFLQLDGLEALDILLNGDPIPFTVNDDMFNVTSVYLDDVAAIHVSPPCQGYSTMSKCRPGLEDEYPKLIAPFRERLIETGKHYIIENVEGARSEMIDPVTLCGTMFGYELYRHRLFETNFPVYQPVAMSDLMEFLDKNPQCGFPHVMPASKAGHWKPGTVMSVAGHVSPIAKAREIMAIDWMTRDELTEAIPPYYANWIGLELNDALA